MQETPGKTIGKRIKALRRKRGLTQEELARRAGMRQGMISRIESGQADEVETSTLIALAKGLEVSTDWLLGLTPDTADEKALARA